jgi:hypothetical protein
VVLPRNALVWGIRKEQGKLARTVNGSHAALGLPDRRDIEEATRVLASTNSLELHAEHFCRLMNQGKRKRRRRPEALPDQVGQVTGRLAIIQEAFGLYPWR